MEMINYRKENPTPELSSVLWPEGTQVRRKAIHGLVCQFFMRTLLFLI